MSEEYQDDSKKKIDRKIVIEHSFNKGKGFETEDIEDIKKERDSYKAIVSLSAEKEFETSLAKYNEEREEFLSLVDDPDKRAEMEKILGEVDPEDAFMLDVAVEKLNNAKMFSTWIRQAVEQSGGRVTGLRAPSGKARIIPQRQSQKTGANDDFKAYIDSLYEIKKDPSRTVREKEEADLMLDELFMEVIKGINVARRRTGRSLPELQVNQCPRCQNLIQMSLGEPFDKCFVCGWELYSKEARRG
jgi:hypothetical protein